MTATNKRKKFCREAKDEFYFFHLRMALLGREAGVRSKALENSQFCQ
jgi:hypothetical protein